MTMYLTGQLTQDMMQTADGELVLIEGNPRIHSAICTLEGDHNPGACYTDLDHGTAAEEELVGSSPSALRF